jgi:hypothetical protein
MGRRQRRAPLWVRELTSRNLHALAGRLLRESQTTDLSDAQNWLLDHCLGDLEWRWSHCEPVWRRCSCWMCAPAWDPVSDGCACAD